MADGHGVDHQSVFIDQPIADQRIDEGCAAVGEDHTSGFALEPVDVLGQVAVGNSAFRLLGAGQRLREGDLRDLVHHVGVIPQPA